MSVKMVSRVGMQILPFEVETIMQYKMEANELRTMDPRMMRVIKAIGTETVTRRGICGNMDLRARKNLWDMYITPAMQQGYVRFLYPNHPNSPDQAYMLTDKGMEAYKALKEQESTITE